MKSIPIQQDNVTQLSADDFNEIPRESENMIQSADITLSSGDLSQLAKASAVYAHGGDFWVDSGSSSANVINLSTVGSRKEPPELFEGMRFRFKAEYTNTAVSVSFKPGALELGAISKVQVPNGGSPEIEIGDIVAGNYYEVFWDKTPDGNDGYYRLLGLPASMITDGTILVESGNNKWEQSNSRLLYRDETAANDFEESFFQPSGAVLTKVTPTDSFGATVSAESTIHESTSDDYDTTHDANGIGFGGTGHPNSLQTSRVSKTWESLTSSGIGPFLTPVSGTVWAATNMFSTGIPTSSRIFDSFVDYTDASGDQWSAPCILKKVANGGQWDVMVNIVGPAVSSEFEPQVLGMQITIEFDGQYL